MIYVCESYPGYRKHLRETSEKPQFSGFKTKVKCLCGVELGPGGGWDTRIPNVAFDFLEPADHGCKDCRVAEILLRGK